ncbi:MAG: LUD domain-containing protein [Anaerolineales bacterium]
MRTLRTPKKARSASSPTMGNGRMVTTLPPIHIALIGMERIVRNLDDLADAIPASAFSHSGKKLTSYTQIVHAPLKSTTPLHHPRQRTPAQLAAQRILYCIRCGSCLNACPIFREIGGHAYKSPYSVPSAPLFRRDSFGSEFVPLAQALHALRRMQRRACPVDADLPKLLVRVRAGQSKVNSDQLSVSGGGLTFMSKFLPSDIFPLRPPPTPVYPRPKIRGAWNFSSRAILNLDSPPCVYRLGLQQRFAAFCEKVIS